MKKFNRPPGGSKEYSGPIQELDLLGSADTENPKYRAAFGEYLDRNKELINKIAGREALSIAERNRLFLEGAGLVEFFPAEDPVNPQKPLLRDLRLQFADNLGLAGEDIDRVRAFSSLRTPLDAPPFDADMFLKINAERPVGEPIYITIDFTTNPDKKTTGADVLIKDLPDPDLKESEYVKVVDRAALDAYRVFLKRKNGRLVY